MRHSTLYTRSLTYHWRTNVAVGLGVAVAGAALTGALLVGDSMRHSLLEVALGRLGDVDFALESMRYLSADTAERFRGSNAVVDAFDRTSAAISVSGGATHAESHTHAERVGIYGVDETFWRLSEKSRAELATAVADMPARSMVINQALAEDLGAGVGDDVLLRMGKPADVSTETVLGRRDDTTTTLRLAVHAILPAEGLGAFSTRPQQRAPRNAFVPLATLQRALRRPDQVNALLVVEKSADERDRSPGIQGVDGLQSHLDRWITLKDLGLTLRMDEDHDYVALESESMLIDPTVEADAIAVSGALGASAEPVFTHLANRIELAKHDGTAGVVIPYSTVAGIAPGAPALSRMTTTSGSEPLPPAPDDILLNDWAAADLGAAVGNSVTLAYYVTGADGSLRTERHSFHLADIVRLEGPASDPGWVPSYPGVTDTENLSDWDAPFPVDFSVVRDKDEDYWDRYRTTPKAFVSLADSQRLWAEDGERLGKLTSLRLYPKGQSLAQLRADFEAALLEQADAARAGFRFEPVRRQAIDASRGSTDFGMLFIGFSFFLIGSAGMLAALLFRLGVERRASEVGLLFATGFEPRAVRRLFLGEGLLIAGIGGAVGLAAAQGYAWLMLAGLRSWWSSAANAPFLRLHVTPTSFAIGYACTLLVALGSVRWSLRGLGHQSTRALLSGSGGSGDSSTKSGRGAAFGAMATLAGAVVLGLLPAVSDAMDPALTFFGSGALVLTACLCAFNWYLRRTPGGIVHRPGPWAVVRLGVRNARRNASRSVLTGSLVASATFIIASLQVFRVEADPETVGDRTSGTGGYALLAEGGLPLPYDLATEAGAEALGLSPTTIDLLRAGTVQSLRLQPGDDSSCLSLYQAKQPRIVGGTADFLDRGGFSFSSTLAEQTDEKNNPWLLLHSDLGEGVIPVIGDDSTVLWLLKLGVGKDLVIADERGRDVTLRFVALLKGSVLRNELVIADAHFRRIFPSRQGPQFFLMDAPVDVLNELQRALERELEPFNVDVMPTATILNRYLSVQNTYLSTFQTLGGLGLVLGTLGLATVMLRNVWERRRELALLRAVGYSPRSVNLLVYSENAILLLVGLLSGCVAAAVAVAPALIADPGSIAWRQLGLILGGILLFGFGASGAALLRAGRGSLVQSLRFE